MSLNEKKQPSPATKIVSFRLSEEHIKTIEYLNMLYEGGSQEWLENMLSKVKIDDDLRNRIQKAREELCK